jgi:hypothetical protein
MEHIERSSTQVALNIVKDEKRIIIWVLKIPAP